MTQPVIILGAARSGTKYLRDILATAGNAKAVPYDISYIWRYRSENYPDDALPKELLTDAKKRFIRSQVFRLAKANEGGDGVVLEKTVGTTLRVPFAAAVFPEAKFIHLVRDGRAVTESAMRQWTEPMDWRRLFAKLRSLPLQNAPYAAWFAANFLRGKVAGRGGGRVWGPQYPGISADIEAGAELVEICAKQWQASVEHTVQALPSIAPERQITVRYEELVAGTDALQRIADFCGLRDVPAMLDKHLARVQRHADEKWKEALTEGQKQTMLQIIEPSLTKLGYVEGQSGDAERGAKASGERV